MNNIIFYVYYTFCYIPKQVSIEKPFFYFNNTKIYYFFDIPHIYKNIRTAFLKYKIDTIYGIADFDVVRKLFILDQSSNSRVCPKLSERHINPSPADKMKVRLATQLLSESVSIGISIMGNLGKFKGQLQNNWQSTATFILNFNRAFDCMNSSKENHDNKYKCGLVPGNDPYNYLKNDFLPYLNEIKEILL